MTRSRWGCWRRGGCWLCPDWGCRQGPTHNSLCGAQIICAHSPSLSGPHSTERVACHAWGSCRDTSWAACQCASHWCICQVGRDLLGLTQPGRCTSGLHVAVCCGLPTSPPGPHPDGCHWSVAGLSLVCAEPCQRPGACSLVPVMQFCILVSRQTAACAYGEDRLQSRRSVPCPHRTRKQLFEWIHALMNEWHPG
jgi:hypothetical protein